MFEETVKEQGDKVALLIERGGKILKWTWKDYQRDVHLFTKAMHKLGIVEGKSVNIMANNSPEWVIAYFGSVTYNCMASGVYPTNVPEACVYQAEHSEAEVIVVDSIQQLKKYESNLGKLPGVKAIVIFGMDKLPSDVNDKRYILWSDFLALGKDVSNDVVADKIRK
jgi:long-subunit acyl-CoA synthetase (AMP-forming)